MTEASLQQFDLHGTRLVRYLSHLAVLDKEFSHENFSERLGRLIDFGDSMRLAALHDKLRGMIFEPGPTSSETPKEEVLRVRMLLMQSVVGSFSPVAGASRIKLPMLDAGVPLDKLASFEPYHHFYAAHQREFASRIQTLQLRVGDAVSAVSAELAQLVALDEAVRDSLSIHARKNLAVIPKLLARRFDFLLQEHQSRQDMSGMAGTGDQSEEDILKTWTRPNGWLDRFFKEMQGLLLAELELRLLPVLGLVEAVNQQVGKK
jgi:hypothetical protein